MGAPLDPHKRYLIVNADDLGMSRGVNRAIFEAHERGIVTSASLMATGAEYDDAVAGARQRPSLDVGIHLVLHGDRPASPPERIPALVGRDGRLRPLGAVVRALLTGAIPPAQVETELAAQIERVRASGLAPSHLDSHCHVHALPAVFRVVQELGRRHGIPCTRLPRFSSFAEFRGAPLSRYPLSVLVSLASRFARPGRGPSLSSPDSFVGLVQSGEVDEAWLARVLPRLARGRISELMVHPSDGTDAGDPRAKYGANRRRTEFEAVTSSAIRTALAAHDVVLVDYRFLAAR